MTVMAAEAGAAEAQAGAREASAGASQAVRNRPRVSGPGRQAQGRSGGSRREHAQRADTARQVRRAAGQPADRTSYQAVVLGEFVAAVLLVAATPFAKRDSPGVSPYAGKDLLQLMAITGVYFILALISGANRGAGRFAAWFGFLILLTVGLGEAARLAKLLNVFGLQPSPADAGTESDGAGGQFT